MKWPKSCIAFSAFKTLNHLVLCNPTFFSLSFHKLLSSKKNTKLHPSQQTNGITIPYNNSTIYTPGISTHSVIGIPDILLQGDLEYPTWLIKLAHPHSFQDSPPALHSLTLPSFQKTQPFQKVLSCVNFGSIPFKISILHLICFWTEQSGSRGFRRSVFLEPDLSLMFHHLFRVQSPGNFSPSWGLGGLSDGTSPLERMFLAMKSRAGWAKVKYRPS